MWHFIIAPPFSVNPTNLQEIPRRAEDHLVFLVNTGWHKNWSKSAFFLKTLIIRAYPVHSLPSQIDPVIFVIAVGLCPRCPANLHKIVKPDYDSKPNSQTAGSLLSTGEVEGFFQGFVKDFSSGRSEVKQRNSGSQVPCECFSYQLLLCIYLLFVTLSEFNRTHVHEKTLISAQELWKPKYLENMQLS